MVRCAGCGYVAVRHRETRELAEVEHETRETGRVPAFQNLKLYRGLFCFVQAADLENEADVDSSAGMLAVLHRERACAAYTPWVQGFTPREHYEMQYQEHLREMERDRVRRDHEWQDARLQEDRDWRARRDQEDRERHDEQMRQARSQQRGELLMIGIGATIILAATTIVGSMIQAGWIGKPWP